MEYQEFKANIAIVWLGFFDKHPVNPGRRWSIILAERSSRMILRLPYNTPLSINGSGGGYINSNFGRYVGDKFLGTRPCVSLGNGSFIDLHGMRIVGRYSTEDHKTWDLKLIPKREYVVDLGDGLKKELERLKKVDILVNLQLPPIRNDDSVLTELLSFGMGKRIMGFDYILKSVIWLGNPLYYKYCPK